jgi:hypothetical protein
MHEASDPKQKNTLSQMLEELNKSSLVKWIQFLSVLFASLALGGCFKHSHKARLDEISTLENSKHDSFIDNF